MRVAIWTSIGFNQDVALSMGKVIVQNQLAVTVLQLALTLGLAAPALATEHEVDQFGAVLDTCYANAATHDARTACIGQMAETCMTGQEGGETTLGMSSCLAAEGDVWDRHLNTEYKALRDYMTAADKDESEYFPEFANRVEALLAAQRAWIAFRDAECALAYAEWGSGSMRHIAGTDCRMQMTAERTIELRSMREMFQ